MAATAVARPEKDEEAGDVPAAVGEEMRTEETRAATAVAAERMNAGDDAGTDAAVAAVLGSVMHPFGRTCHNQSTPKSKKLQK